MVGRRKRALLYSRFERKVMRHIFSSVYTDEAALRILRLLVFSISWAWKDRICLTPQKGKDTPEQVSWYLECLLQLLVEIRFEVEPHSYDEHLKRLERSTKRGGK